MEHTKNYGPLMDDEEVREQANLKAKAVKQYNEDKAFMESVSQEAGKDLYRVEDSIGEATGPGYYSNKPDHNKIKSPGVVFVTGPHHAQMLTKDVLPTLNNATPKERKQTPIATGVLDYFPDAIAAVAQCSFTGNEQHNPGQHLHWDKSKSTDHADCILRHLIQRGTVDGDGIRHAAKVAWRALALLQIEIENAERMK